MGTTAPLLVNVTAYPPGTVPPLDAATIAFDAVGNSGRSPATPTVENGYYPAGLGDNIAGKFYTDAETSIKVPVLGNNSAGLQNKTTAAAAFTIYQPANPRIESRHTRCEIGLTRIQYFSIKSQRWIEVYGAYPAISAASEDLVGGGTAPDSFAMPNGNISVRSGTNARLTAGTFTGRTNNGQGNVQQVGYRITGIGNRVNLPWNDAECVLISTPMRTVGPGSLDAVPKYVAGVSVNAWEGQSAGGPGFGSQARLKPVTSVWQNFTCLMGPQARVVSDAPLGSATNPFQIDIALDGPTTTFTELRTKIRAAITNNPTGPLNLRIAPAGAVVNDVGSMVLDSVTDGINGNRAIGIDWANLTMAGQQGSWEKMADRLPVFGRFNFEPGQAAAVTGRIKFILRTNRLLPAPANQRYSLSPLPPTIRLAIRTTWGLLRSDMELPDSSVAGQVSWSFSQQMSDYLKIQADGLTNLFSTELSPAGDTPSLDRAFAAWILYPEPTGSNTPALTLNGVSNLKMYGLNIRDRTLGMKNYWINQTGDVFGRLADGSSPHRTAFGYDRIATTGLRINVSTNVEINDCLFYNLDGDACSTDVSTNNYRFRRNTFHDIGCNALVHGSLYQEDTYLPQPYGDVGVFERNAFYRVGLNQINGSPIFASGNLNLQIIRNIIKTCTYSGITVGYPIFTRGAAATPQYYTNQVGNCTIDGNLVEGAMNANVDGGGIYMLGPNVGGQLRNNTIRNIGTARFDVNTAVPLYGTYIAVGQGNVYPAPVARVYYDNGSFGWVASNNNLGTAGLPDVIDLFKQTGTTESGADAALTAGVGTPNVLYTVIPLTTVPPLVNGIVDRAAMFASYGVAP